jgi:hypothetical protein
MHEFERTFKYNNTEVLILSINYPIINIKYNPRAEQIINNQIAMNVNEYMKYSRHLYNQAVKGLKDSQANNYPFHSYSAYMEYNITYNENCHLSAYNDKYEFTGGAHGLTARSSDSWELCTGKHLSLNDFFDPNANYRQFITDEITRQAEYNNQQNSGIYFEDYESLIIKSFDQHNFYLTPQGITFYFQQYDIAPYSTGIAEFIIPYNKINWYPKCYKTMEP